MNYLVTIATSDDATNLNRWRAEKTQVNTALVKLQ